jgi:MSHA pilin protein MshA
MNKQNGFTLVELVAVIVLLGILAVAALPRFIDLRGDARTGTLEAIVGSTRSAAVQVYAKALIQNKIAASQDVIDGSAFISTEFGYPAANGATNKEDISDLVDVDGDATVVWAVANDANTDRIIGYDDDSDGDIAEHNCYVTYTESSVAGTLPGIVITRTGC